MSKQSFVLKQLPLSADQLEQLTQQYPTPFYLYDASQIAKRVKDLQRAFSSLPNFREYFAVKALPNPAILQILKDLGCGVDCASLTELLLAKKVGLAGEQIMFTSSNTPPEDEVLAQELGAIVNFDSPEYIDFYRKVTGTLPKVACVRYSPLHEIDTHNDVMGSSGESKFGMRRDQVFASLAKLRDLGVERLGVHSMLASNSLDASYYPKLAELLFNLTVEVKDKLGIELEFLNFAGGLGIPYLPEQAELDIFTIGEQVAKQYEQILQPAKLQPAIFSELGRWVSGPAGFLVTRVLHKKHTYKHYIGVDANSVNLLRPAMYGAYHHISVVGKDSLPATQCYDVVGSLCENNDKLAIDRNLPEIEIGDLLVIHDVGAHGFSMGYNYNGRLKCAEILLQADGNPRLIRRGETPEDYFATLID